MTAVVDCIYDAPLFTQVLTSRGAALKSLFVISLPRSLSSLSYHAARISLELNEPIWTSDGEILNSDRFIFHKQPVHDSPLRFTRIEKDPEAFRKLTAFLSETVKPEGFVYKDVVHPFVVSAWLPHSGFRVLKIKRDLVDVCYSMIRMNWFYPARAVEGEQDSEDSFIEGLIHAQRAIESVPGECICYDDLIHDEEVLRAALRRLYPDEDMCRVRFIDDEFREETAKIMERKQTPLYQSLQRKIEAKMQTMNYHATAFTYGELK